MPYGVDPSGITPATTDGTTLTTVGGLATWLGVPVLLLAAGAAVPAGTPSGTIILRKA